LGLAVGGPVMESDDAGETGLGVVDKGAVVVKGQAAGGGGRV
jgi:hypothetical protein